MMTYATIIKAVWREYPDDASIKKLQVNMANIRKKFGAYPGEVSYIANELGVGYRMNS
jgi:two-component system KDP operon response regulator KdpE